MWPEPAGLGATGVADALELLPHAPSVDPADRVGVRERKTADIEPSYPVANTAEARASSLVKATSASGRRVT